MTRNVLIVVHCLAVAALGISGLQGHLAGGAGPQHHPTHEKHGFQPFALSAVAPLDDLLKRIEASPDFLRFADEARVRDAEIRLAELKRSRTCAHK